MRAAATLAEEHGMENNPQLCPVAVELGPPRVPMLRLVSRLPLHGQVRLIWDMTPIDLFFVGAAI